MVVKPKPRRGCCKVGRLNTAGAEQAQWAWVLSSIVSTAGIQDGCLAPSPRLRVDVAVLVDHGQIHKR